MIDTKATESQRLRRKIAIGFTDFADAARDIRNHADFRALLQEYYFTMHCIMRATVPLMHCALEESIRRSKTDAVAARLVNYYGEHIPEELGHDDWLLENASYIGMQPGEILERMPPASVAALSGAQYYWIRHYHPVVLIGYIAVVEGYPPTEEAVSAMAQKSGFQIDAFSSMMRHARLDQVHRADLDKFLDTLKLTNGHRHSIGVSAFSTIGAATRALRDTVDRFESGSRSI